MSKEKTLLKPISITAIATISPLGNSLDKTWRNYKTNIHFISEKVISKQSVLISELSSEVQSEIELLRQSEPKYKVLDNSVLYAIYTSRKAVKQANWNSENQFGINIGSSRGATQLFETYHEAFLKNNISHPLSSPTTTLGNISSWVAHDLNSKGPEISHSITCSTALHAMLNGIAWINAGMADKFLVGGSEAPLTGFTIAQMQALKIYAKHNSDYPCRALEFTKSENTMVLGEAASSVCLEQGETKNALALVKSFGYATELLEHNASLSANAICFQRSMTMALGDMHPDTVDVIVTHTPGTIKGDISEFNAIKTVFYNKRPSLTNNKWKIGHSLGASGLTSIEMAVLMLKKQEFIPVPFCDESIPKKLQNILINAVGFGGNAVSILVTLPNTLNKS